MFNSGFPSMFSRKLPPTREANGAGSPSGIFWKLLVDEVSGECAAQIERPHSFSNP